MGSDKCITAAAVKDYGFPKGFVLLILSPADALS